MTKSAQTIRWFETDRFFDADTINELPIFSVDTVVYSPDCSKLYAILFIEYDTSLGNINEPYFKNFNGKSLFAARGIIGYKEAQNSTWKLYAYSMLISELLFSYENVKEQTRNYYFNKIKEDLFLYKIEDGDAKDKKLGCNIGDDIFWDTFVWQKNLLLKGYYNFELQYKGLEDPPIPIIMPPPCNICLEINEEKSNKKD